ncbi:MAG: IS256 family transposase [Nitrospinae bacterium]|nr:IS256 family transposase [Nitrospinota bacterium]
MGKNYHILDKKHREELSEYLSREGQLLLPLVELLETAEMAVDELIDVACRSTIEAVLKLSAQGIAGEKQQGKQRGEIGWHGRQSGVISLAERKLRVKRPRLRRKGKGKDKEVMIPAYEAMRFNESLGSRVLEILLSGVSTRNYKKVLPRIADTVGVSKSSVSREFVEASEEELKRLCEKPLHDLDLLAIYLDGMVFAKHHIVAAVGVDRGGYKHVLGLAQGSSENAAVCIDLLQDLVKRGVDPTRNMLFVIDGSKALRSAIDQVFGQKHPVQRCRNHKIKNVMDHLPDELKDQVKAVMKAAWKLDTREGMARLKKQAQWLETEHPGAAGSLREGMEEMFTLNHLGLPPTLTRCLATTNIIESPNGGVRRRTRRVSRWRDGKMILRWAASAFLDAEKNFRRIMGYKDLWILEAALGRSKVARIDKKKRAA